MYAVSQEYIEAMHRPVQRHKLTGTIGETTFDESDILSGSFSLNGQCSDTSNVQIGQVYITELKMTLVNKPKFERYSLKGAEIRPEFGLGIAPALYEYVPLGVFTITQASWGAGGIEITAYDYMAKFDRSFSASTLNGTAYDLTMLACDSCGVALAMRKEEFDAFANGTEKLSLYPDNDIQSWRDVIAWLAQTLGANALIDREGQLYFKRYGSEVIDTIPDTQRFTGASFGDYETRYTGLSCVNIEAQTTSYYGETVDDGLTYNLGSNPFLQTEVTAAIDEMRRNVLTALGEILYVPFKVEMIGNPAYDLMDCFRFTDGIADGTKISCLTKYTFKFNGKYTAQGVGQNPALVSAKSKSDKNIAGLMASIDSITSSINHLIYDYNTGPLMIGQQEETVGMLSFYITERADIEGHFLMDYYAEQSTHMTIRFYDTLVEELYSPIEIDVLEGQGSIGIPHSFLHRERGIHAVYATVQCTLGTIKVDTRGVFFTINAGNFATAVDEISMDVMDITMRQLLESNGPDEIWTVGIEQDTMIASKRPYAVTPDARVEWTGVYSPGKAKTAAIEFDGDWVLRTGAKQYTLQTEDQPWYFWVDMDDRLIAQHGDDEDLRLVLDQGVTKISVCKGYSSILYPGQDQGLICAYVKTDGSVWYRQYVLSTALGYKVWSDAVRIGAGESWNDVRVNRLNDYRVSFVLSNLQHNIWLISKRTYVAQSVYPENYNRLTVRSENNNFINLIGYYPKDYVFPTVAVSDFTVETIEEDGDEKHVLHITLDHEVFGSERTYALKKRISFNESIDARHLESVVWTAADGETEIILTLNSSPTMLKTEIYINELMDATIRVKDTDGTICPFEQTMTVVWDYTNYVDALASEALSHPRSSAFSIGYLAKQIIDAEAEELLTDPFRADFDVEYKTVSFMNGDAKEEMSSFAVPSFAINYYNSGDEPV